MNKLSIRQKKAISISLFDTLGSLDGSTNLFIELYSRIAFIIDPSKSISVNKTYKGVVIACCSFLSIIDGYVHYKMYSKKRYESASKDANIDFVSPNEPENMPTNSQKYLSKACAFVCSLESISVPLAVTSILKDNGFLDKAKSSFENFFVLGVTFFSALINLWNMKVMYNLSRENLSSAASINVSTNINSKLVNILQSGSRALFNALGSVVENSNFIFKAIQSIAFLSGLKNYKIDFSLKIITLSIFSLFASTVFIARYYTYKFYNSTSNILSNNLSNKGIKKSNSNDLYSEITNPISIGESCISCSAPEYDFSKSINNPLLLQDSIEDLSVNKTKKTTCKKKCCNGLAKTELKKPRCKKAFSKEHFDSEDFVPNLEHYLEHSKDNQSRVDISSLGYIETSQNPLDLSESGQNSFAFHNSQIETIDENSHQKSPLLLKRIAYLSTISSLFTRVSVPYAFITLYESSDIIDKSEFLQKIGLAITVTSLFINIWNSSVVYDFYHYHLTNKKGSNECECCQHDI